VRVVVQWTKALFAVEKRVLVGQLIAVCHIGGRVQVAHAALAPSRLALERPQRVGQRIRFVGVVPNAHVGENYDVFAVTLMLIEVVRPQSDGQIIEASFVHGTRFEMRQPVVCEPILLLHPVDDGVGVSNGPFVTKVVVEFVFHKEKGR